MMRLMDLNTSLLKTCESWNMNSNYQEWHNTTFKDTEERIALWVARWRMLELLRKESQWTLGEGIWILDEPSCRTFMKNSGKQKNDPNNWLMKRMRLKPRNDLDRDLRDNIIERGWNSGKKDEQMRSRIWRASGIRN